MKKILRLILIFFGCQLVFGQNIRHLSVGDGLPQSFVSALLQDEQGFVWIGTRSGLARYDGLNFKTFQHYYKDKSSLASNVVDHLKKDARGNLWIKYENAGVDYLNLQSYQIEHIISKDFLKRNNLTMHRKCWLISKKKVLWFKTSDNQLYTYDVAMKKLVRQNSANLTGQVIYNIVETKNNDVYILTKKHLIFYHDKNQQIQKIPIPYEAFGINVNDSEVILLHQRKNGDLLWMDKMYTYSFSIKKQSFNRYRLPIPVKNNIKLLSTDKQGNEYFVVDNRIYSFHDNGELRELINLKDAQNRKIQAFLIDQSGLLWVGSDANGVHIINPKLNFKPFYYRKDFAADVLEKYYGISNGNPKVENSAATGVSSSYFLRSAKVDHKMFIALYQNVWCYDEKLKKSFTLPELPNNRSRNFAPIKGISIMGKNPIVIDENKDIYLYNGSAWSVLFSLDTYKVNIQPSDIYFNNALGLLYVATESHGLLKIKVNNGQVQHILNNTDVIPVNQLITLIADPIRKNILWMGSSEGLIQYNEETNKSKLFSEKDGFPDHVIYSLKADSQKNLWMGTNKGLVQFNLKKYSTKLFTKAHGLENFEFNRFHSLALPNDQLAFGGVNTGVIFKASDILPDHFSPPTVITDISLNNIKIPQQIYREVNQIKKLTVDYAKNTVAIKFAALQFDDPYGMQYRYRLKNYQDEWVVVGHRTEAVFTKLPPGNYVFEVNASNTTGKWSTQIKSLQINVTPPWWKTWWAITMYIAFFIASIFGFIRFRIKQANIKNVIKLKQIEAQELKRLDEIKTNFFTNIAHEFRTPLSLIVGPAEQLKSAVDDDEKEILYSSIHKNTLSLIQLTDQLLDMAKLEAGVLTPQWVWGDIVPVVSNIVKAFSATASQNGISINLKSPKKAEFLFSINIIDRILYNLISNAIKFCKRGDTVLISIEHHEGGLSMIVKDSGLGIPSEEQNKIFSRYYQGSNNNFSQGNGLGLSLVKELVDRYHGEISFQSSTQPPSGTSFHVWLPFKTHEMTPLVYASDRNSDHQKETILIVEDHRELADFLLQLLSKSYQVTIAKNGKEALDIIQDKLPQLVISDVTMDEMDGFDLCKAIKEDISLNHIPVILLTARADEKSKIEGLSYGAEDYLVKPFNLEELRLKIENILRLQKRLNAHFKNYLLDKELNNTKRIDGEDSYSNEKLYDDFLQKIHEIIELHLDQQEFGVDALAESLAMSRTSLHRKVKMMFNISTGEIIKNYRLKKASELLKKNYTSAEVAYMTGFSSPSYFTKCFKEFFGKTPSQYP